MSFAGAICPYSVNFQRQIETNYGFSDPSGCEVGDNSEQKFITHFQLSLQITHVTLERTE